MDLAIAKNNIACSKNEFFKKNHSYFYEHSGKMFHVYLEPSKFITFTYKEFYSLFSPTSIDKK